MMIDANMSAGVDHSDLTDAEKKRKGIETDDEAAARRAKTAKKKEKSMSEATTTTAAKSSSKKASKPKGEKGKTKAKAKAKPKETARNHVALTEKQMGEAREVVRLLPAVLKMAETYRTSTPARKEAYESISQVIEHMLVKAFNRQAALDRYNGQESKLVN